MTTGPSATVGAPAFDRLTVLRPGQEAVAYLNVTATLPLLATHFPRYPILPGVLIVEGAVALARLAAGIPELRLRHATRLRFRRFIVPGDRVELTATAHPAPGAAGDSSWRAEARVDGEIAASIGTLTLTRALG
ncbi:3-hydroxyacyl-ACP dehydratase FabZ family protein [Nocardia wallacei]|uniref:3-hydroxyacyl-ACP dehydratase FabZ family protein n=1 Tax=Nocardia wallacei TaxID=480035 RepID=UPI002456E890|nr:hypothetical protein [Nocardia wallacei]